MFARFYIASVMGLGAVAFFHGVFEWRASNFLQIIIFIAMAIPASRLKVRLPGVRFGTISGLFLFLMAGIARLGLAETLLTGVVCVAVERLWNSRFGARAVQVAFSMALVAIAITAADWAYRAASLIGRGAPQLAAAVTMFFALTTVGAAAVIGMTEDKSIRQVWVNSYLWSYPYYLAGAVFLGTFIYSARVMDPGAAILILSVLWVVYHSHRLYLRRVDAEGERAEAERRRAREAAALHEETLRAKLKLDAVFRASPLAILTVDRHCVVTSWNAGAESMFGWQSAEVLGKPLPVALKQCENDLERLISRTLAGEAVRGVETTQSRRDRTPFDGEIWTAVLPEAGEAPAVLITIADVSDRKRLDEQLRQSQKMEAIGRLAGGVAHDFNNLLTVINGYSSLLMDPDHADRLVVSHVQQILNAGTRAAELVSCLLTFSRRQMIQPARIDVNGIVSGLEKMLVRLIADHIDLRLELDPDAGSVFADSGQMESVLLNLASNARDAMPDGGILTISTACVEITGRERPGIAALPPGSYVRLSARDTGSGMDEETRERLFEPFYTTKGRGRGTGLGLASVLGAVEQNQGRIFVDTKMGCGSTFSIFLPRVGGPERAPAACSVRRDPAPGGSETILLVEDQQAGRGLFCGALRDAGYSVIEARDGVDAIRCCTDQSGPIDLVVTDLVTPAMNGVRLVDELRKARPGIPAICISGRAPDVIGSRSEFPPGVDFLQKPLPPDLLIRRARQVLDRQPA